MNRQPHFTISLKSFFEIHAIFVLVLEPGYYEDGHFGIRIENVMLVKEVRLKVNYFSVDILIFYNCIHFTFYSLMEGCPSATAF